MQLAPIPTHETERLADLRAMRILDTPPERRFDRIVELARRVFHVPIAYISMVDADRQWFKSRLGLKVLQTPRDISFCGHAILQDEPLVIPDATLDPRFVDNPLVTGEPHVRFYAGHPLKGPSGRNVGTLCILDHRPRTLNENERAMLHQLAAMVEHELNVVDLIDTQRQLLDTKTQLVAARQKLAEELTTAAAYVRSLLPPRLSGELASDYWFIPSSHLGGDIFGHHWLDERRLAVYLLDVTGHGVSAALLSISVYQTLRRQTLADTPFDRPDRVLAALNRAYPMEEHGNKFFTIWYGVYDRQERVMSYANGGHPPPILLPSTTSANEGDVLEGGDLIVGVMPDADYSPHQRVIEPGSRMYIFSDGAYEIQNPQGKMLTPDGLNQTLRQTIGMNGSSLRFASQALLEFRGGDSFDDDVSLLEMRFH